MLYKNKNKAASTFHCACAFVVTWHISIDDESISVGRAVYFSEDLNSSVSTCTDELKSILILFGTSLCPC